MFRLPRGLLRSNGREEVDKIAVRITKINRAGTPWLGGWYFDPLLHKIMQTCILLINVIHSELQDCAVVLSRHCGARNVFFLCLGGEQRENSRASPKVDVGCIDLVGFRFQNFCVESSKPVDIAGDEAGVDQRRNSVRYWLRSAAFAWARHGRR